MRIAVIAQGYCLQLRKWKIILYLCHKIPLRVQPSKFRYGTCIGQKLTFKMKKTSKEKSSKFHSTIYFWFQLYHKKQQERLCVCCCYFGMFLVGFILVTIVWNLLCNWMLMREMRSKLSFSTECKGKWDEKDRQKRPFFFFYFFLIFLFKNAPLSIDAWQR